jgi:general secretion pathway protein C
VGSALSVDEKQLAAGSSIAKGVVSVASPGSKARSAEAILSRNPFDSVAGPLNKAPEVPVVAGEGDLEPPPSLTDPMAAPPCDGIKVLVITASSDPEWSFAALSVSGENKTILRRRGMEAGNKKVVFVGWDRVWFENNRQICQATMYQGDKPLAPPPSPVAAAPSGRPASPNAVPPDIAKGIQKVRDGEYNVDRAVVEKILENQAELMKSARIVPEQENGKTVGIRLFGVRPDTLLGALGMENGDRLQTINGFEVASPEKALEAYARLRTADHLTITVNRRGTNQNLDFNIK